MMAAATLLTASSCTDFDDYNEAYTAGSAESKQTIWENISSREDLTQFAALLKKGGYDKVLSNSTFVTVWAPKDGTYDFDSLMNKVDSATLVNRFVKNHIANYNHNAVGEPSRVRLLSGKSYILGNGKFGDRTIYAGGMNIPGVNGLLHILEDGMEVFNPNVYEYVMESAGDSLSSYFKKYERPYFDASQSVVGPINEFGEQTYSDSVIVQINSLIGNDYTGSRGLLRAALSNEDSVYTMLIPTDRAYKNAYEKIRSYYKYPANGQIKYQPISSTGLAPEQTVTVNSEYVTDSIARLNVASALIYSHGNLYNRWWTTGSTPTTEIEANDTICSSLSRWFSNGTEMFSTYMTGDEVILSNGYARVVDSLAMHPWDSWAGELYVDISSDRTTDRYIQSASYTLVSVRENNFNTAIGEYFPTYLELAPINDSSQPDVYFRLSGVKSTSYNVYVTLLPANINKVENEEDMERERLTQLNAEIGFFNSKGKTEVLKFKNDAGSEKLLTDSANLGKVDTFFVGRVDFPYSYATTDASPYLRLKISRSKYNSKEKEYTQYLRIGRIVLRPVEYDEYLKNEE